MRHTFHILLCLLALAAASACSRTGGSGKKTLAVSTEPQRALLAEIAGPDYDIVTLLPPSADAETYEPSVSTLTALQNSAAYFTTSAPGFEQAILPRVKENFPGVEIVETTAGITPVDGTHGHDADPHVWSSPRNARVMARNMLRALTAISPADSALFRTRWERLDSSLACLDDSLRRILADAPSRAFAIWHPSLSYFARDYGLRQIALETDGKETTPRQLRTRLDSLRSADVGVIFYERAHGAGRAAAVAAQLGFRTAELQLNDSTWRQSLIDAARLIAAPKKRPATEENDL